MTTMLDFLRASLVVFLVALLPVVILILAGIIIRMHRGRSISSALGIALADGLVAVSLAAILAVGLRPSYGIEASMNLIPFQSLLGALRSGPYDVLIALVNLAGNFAIFVPLGAAVVLRRPGTGRLALVVATAILSITVELAQSLLNIGRAADIDDLIMNSLGGLSGFELGRRLLPIARGLWPRPAVPEEETTSTD